MDIFNKFLSLLESKRQNRDALCCALTKQIREANKAITNLTGRSGYIPSYVFSDAVNKWKQLEIDLPKLERQVRKSSYYKEMSQEARKWQMSLANLERAVDAHNKAFLKNVVADAYLQIGDIEGRPLDFQQMACIVKDAPNHLVIAGAGTGKTTTILGKVKYLLATGMCKEDEILVLSFTNAAASEMKARLMKETQLDIKVSTFHKLGLNIIREVEGKTPFIYKGNSFKFIREQIDICRKEPEYARLLMQYLLFHQVNQKSEFDFDSFSSYRDYLNTNPPTTIKGITVKSYGEMEIANFLTQQGLEYQYEAPYVVDTRTTDYGQYYPDFFLPQYNIYIEYYGVNEYGEVPSYYTGRHGKSAAENYRDRMKWHSETHRENKTTLLTCFYHEKVKGSMLENLCKNLQKQGVILKPVTLDYIFEQMDVSKKHVLDGLAEQFQAILSLTKSNRLPTQELLDLCSREANKGLRITAQLFNPIYDAYEKMLSKDNCIDFSDMINIAANYVVAGKYHHKYKYVIVDEYQDISKGQYLLLQSMRNDAFFSLFCVGDDWQSIYRFAGSDIGYILHFDHYWGASEISKIETTYRFSQRLIDITGSFIMVNTNQKSKTIRASNDSEKYVIGEIMGYTDKWAIQFMVSKVEDLPLNSTVYFIGRYQSDVNLLKDSSYLHVSYNNTIGAVDVVLPSRPDLKMVFYTAHKSKGLQADYVFIINNRSNYMGFPSRITNSPMIDLLLEKADTFPDAEERRLYYVAMTRAKRRVYLVTTDKNVSSFALELKKQYQDEMRRESFICPRCGSSLVKQSGEYGLFYGCSNFKVTGCEYTRKIGKKKLV